MSSMPRILIVEDERLLAEDLAESLESIGYEIAGVVSTGIEATRKVEENTPDLILMDVVLTGPMDGIETAARIRARYDVPVVYLSGHSDQLVLERAKITEPSAYLIKPCTDADLRTTIELALYRSAMERRVRESEQRLREGEAQFRLTFENANDAILWIDPGTGVIVRCNRAAEALLEKPRQEIVGFHHTLAHPPGKGKLCEQMLKSTHGQPRGQEYETEVLTKSGKEVTVFVRASATDIAGNTIVQAIMRDVTEQKRASEDLRRAHDELELRVRERTAELAVANENLRTEIDERSRAERNARESEARFRAIFETATDCIFIKDRGLRYTFVNPCFASLLELPESAIAGKADHDLFGTVAGGHLKEVDGRVLRGDVIEEEHTRPVKGIPLTFLDVRAPMRNADGEIVGICGISRNITERSKTSFELPPAVEHYPSAAMKSVLESVRMASNADCIVLITGESGSGKDFLARRIHDDSGRSSGPFYAVNCAAIPPELAESELFGHEAGAFTGAMRRKRGLVELAEGGTLLLNEIGDLSVPLQAKLLTFLDTFSFTRVGGEKSVSVNVRLIAATNKELVREVSEGRFRKDLYYRLNVLSIQVPPLRDRVEDIPILAVEILRRLASDMQLPRCPEMTREVIETMCEYLWPGNVRELRNVLERALMLSRGGPVTGDHVGLVQTERPMESKAGDIPAGRSLYDVLGEMERSLIEEALCRARGRKHEAARILGISRFALTRHMQKLGLVER